MGFSSLPSLPHAFVEIISKATWWQTWHTLTKVYARSDQNWFCGKKPKYFTAGIGLHGHCADSMVKFKLASLVKPRGAFCNVCRGGRSPLWSTPKLDARENPHKGVQSFYYCFIFCFSQEPDRLHIVLIYSVVWEIGSEMKHAKRSLQYASW